MKNARMPIAASATFLLLAATAATATVAGQASQASAAAKPAERAARISDLMLARLVEANGVPGMGAAVVRDGEVLWSGSAGLRDVGNGLPVDRHTIFRLASVSKLLTATAAAQLREQGRLDVDAPVQGMLPWLDADWAPITPRQLASHVSGLPHYQDVDEGRGAVRFSTVRDAVGIFEGRPLLSAPGAEYGYSSWGYTLLSAAVEAGAGQPFLEVVTDRVAPGLAIGPDATDSGHPQASKAYAFIDGAATPAPRHDFSYTWGGGGLGSTPEAIALFGSRVMSGGIVSPATFEWMLEPARLEDGSVVRERDFEVGFGWRVSRTAEGDRIAHHAGVTDGARSALVLWPDEGTSASVLSNALWVSSIEQTATMLAAPFRVDAASARAASRPCPVRTARYEAEFEGIRWQGDARFGTEGGVCVGRMELGDNPLRHWLNGFPQRDAQALSVVGIDWQGGLDRAALVTPIGLHPMEMESQEASAWRVKFGATRMFSIRFMPQAR